MPTKPRAPSPAPGAGAPAISASITPLANSRPSITASVWNAACSSGGMPATAHRLLGDRDAQALLAVEHDGVGRDVDQPQPGGSFEWKVLGLARRHVRRHERNYRGARGNREQRGLFRYRSQDVLLSTPERRIVRLPFDCQEEPACRFPAAFKNVLLHALAGNLPSIPGLP